MDAVILYVNCDDSAWRASFKKKMGRDFKPNRFRDWGTLPFLFRGIAKYMPFIEKVHLVVSGESQVPGWIDREKVHVVYHKDIIPEQYLPTFNSCVIETHIPYIEGLSEEFIYFNDDFFPINPCDPELFFKEGRPQDMFEDRNIMYGMNKIYHRQCWNSMNWAKDALGMEKSMNFLMPKHWPHPMLKSYCLEILQIQADKYGRQVSPLRTKENVNQYLFLDYMYLGGVSDRVNVPYGYAEPKKGIDRMVECILHSQAKVICLNDNGCSEEDYPVFREKVCRAFMEKFPEPCRYEKARGGDLIVSMTSYPARIGYAVEVWHSVLKQETDTSFRCVMVLIESEWPEKKIPFALQELADLGQIEILWYPKNIRSHAKLLPVIEKYPDADIITIDDDMAKPQRWLQNMILDHRKWPEDVISCSFTYYLDSDFQWQRMLDLPQRDARGKNDVPSLVFQFARICSGHGTIFPAHTFTDRRFFDTEGMMTITPTCDETWMWCFAMLSGRHFRQSSWVFDESAYNIDKAYRMPTALWRANKNTYDEMYARLFNAYPEFREELKRRQGLYVLATQKTRHEASKKNPYVPVIVAEDESCIPGLMKAYQDFPNKKIRTEGGTLYPPGI